MRPNIDLLDLPDNKKIVFYKTRIEQLEDAIKLASSKLPHNPSKKDLHQIIEVNQILQEGLGEGEQ